MRLKRNLANWDRIARVVAGGGTAITAGVMLAPGWQQLVLGGSGLFLALTGIAARCPVCQVTGISTHDDS